MFGNVRDRHPQRQQQASPIFWFCNCCQRLCWLIYHAIYLASLTFDRSCSVSNLAWSNQSSTYMARLNGRELHQEAIGNKRHGARTTVHSTKHLHWGNISKWNYFCQLIHREYKKNWTQLMRKVFGWQHRQRKKERKKKGKMNNWRLQYSNKRSDWWRGRPKRSTGIRYDTCTSHTSPFLISQINSISKFISFISFLISFGFQ